ncbi:MAG: hypothetical protein H6625_11830, partial [Bdellovibrionaceae bacterium]|nr:hypothetical protein [Pseudobdellovibrionaceae bacterium]
MKKMRSIDKQGMGIIEVLVATGILAIIISAMTSFMASQLREINYLTQNLAKLDTEKLLIAALSDGAICSAELTNSTLNPSAPFTIDTSTDPILASQTITLTSLHASSTPGSPILIQNGIPPSAITNNLLVDSIQFINFQRTGDPNRFLANLMISFDGNLTRNLKPIFLKKIIDTNPASPVNSKQITGCLSSGASMPPTITNKQAFAFC